MKRGRCKAVASQSCGRYKSELVNQGDGDKLIRLTGDVDSALDMYARNGDWTKCLSLAEKQSPKMLPHYLARACR